MCNAYKYTLLFCANIQKARNAYIFCLKTIDFIRNACYNIIREREQKPKHNKEEKKMNEKKNEALKAYKEAKNKWLENRNESNWKEFCEAKRACMLLGVRI